MRSSPITFAIDKRSIPTWLSNAKRLKTHDKKWKNVSLPLAFVNDYWHGADAKPQ
jgi:hypothetical protein